MSGVPSSAGTAAHAAAANAFAAAFAAQQSENDNSRRNAGGEASGGGSSERRRSSTTRTLADAMREPSTTVPGVVVLDSVPEDSTQQDVLDPKEDLWLSTADGRYSSPIIPLRVGETPRQETFYVHKNVLLKSEYFERALCGDFSESGTQSIDLPEEDPATFHFLVSYLYEGRYEPIRPASSVLAADQDKGKGIATAETGAESDSDSGSSVQSDISARSRRRRERRRRREEERMRRKHPGVHRPNCNCPRCVAASGPPCWSCRAPRNPPPNMYVGERDPWGRPERNPRRPPRHNRHRHGPVPPPPPPLSPPHAGNNANNNNPWGGAPADPNGGRIAGEDLRTWLLAYELNLDVYILANKFLLEGFKKEVAHVAVDMLESAGSDAAVGEVLFLCRKLYDGLPETDPLLKMVFARVGFLQPWRRAPRETSEFMIANPEIAPLLLREMAARREDDVNGRALPSMVRPWYGAGPPPPGGAYHPRTGPQHPVYRPLQGWMM